MAAHKIIFKRCVKLQEIVLETKFQKNVVMRSVYTSRQLLILLGNALIIDFFANLHTRIHSSAPLFDVHLTKCLLLFDVVVLIMNALLNHWVEVKPVGTDICLRFTILHRLSLFELFYDWTDVELVRTCTNGATLRINGVKWFVSKSSGYYEEIIKSANQ